MGPLAPESAMLLASAAAIAFGHTLLGPDHYLPFVAMARARNWSLGKTLRITLWCGAGHLAGSVGLGLLGVTLGIGLSSVSGIEAARANLAAWLLIAFGLVYMAWGLRRAWRNRPHTHWHSHAGVMHRHEHRHLSDHVHVHDASSRSLAPWLIFVIFVLGPCEPLIPLLMYPAARQDAWTVISVTLVFGVVTVATMLLTVSAAALGLQAVRLRRVERYGHALAGAAILGCGAGIVLFGW